MGWFTSGTIAPDRHRAARGHGDQRAPARRRGLRLLGAEPGDPLGDAARARARRSARRRSPATTAAPTSTTPTACSPTAAPWISAAQVGGEIGAYGANRHGDADSQMLSYQANGIGVAVEAVEAGAPVVVLRHEIVPDTAGPGRHRGGASMLRDSLWLRDAPASPDVAALQAPARLRRARGRRRRDRRDLDFGRGWARPGPFALGPGLLRRRHPGRGRARPADARALPRRRLPLPVPRALLGDRARRGAALRQLRRRRLGRPARARPRRRQARRARRLRDDRGGGPRLRRRRSPATPTSTPRASCSIAGDERAARLARRSSERLRERGTRS